METLLQDIVVNNIFAFLLIFMRLGTALMIMPGVGDTFVSQQTRLLFAVAFSFVLSPFLSPLLPTLPGSAIALGVMLVTEGMIGVFMGTIMRIMISALDTAGAVVSMQAGLSAATVFNPANATQGSMTGALYSMLGVALILMTDMHHAMLGAIVESYSTFPAGSAGPSVSDMTQTIGEIVSLSFRIGVQMAIPFLIVGTLVQVGFGLLGRMMPQVQVFFLALPIQIFLCLLIFAMTLSVTMMYWLNSYDGIVNRALAP